LADSEQGENDVVIFLQQWHPSSYTLGEKVELCLKYGTLFLLSTNLLTSEEMTLADFKEFISNKFSVSNVGVAKAFGSWPGPEVVEVPDLDWDRQV
jgi:hypothetical protein